MSFMREDKMNSSNSKKESWKFQRNQIESLFEVILKTPFNLELFSFYSNYFSPKIKYMENRVNDSLQQKIGEK